MRRIRRRVIVSVIAPAIALVAVATVVAQERRPDLWRRHAFAKHAAERTIGQ